ncbi:hypothetical protein PRIPAC_78482 [Pristionchus pacificus]|uniref:Uncharacterized protein n=1 Tax=Pristionchus pacificus TaxID=54126 RepID=A0A2A6CML8_PRIPA|nr:hypothetical protein PRIPAC_78482 [Pristionchus pacificus]|eukprot:PDM79359.1 hypothetical protein PRIPAC_31938 [Pristionchus pacificus]
MDDWITWTCYGMALVVGNCSQFSDHMVRVVDKFPRSLQCFLLATVILVRQAIVRYGPGCRYKEQSTDMRMEFGHVGDLIPGVPGARTSKA